MRLQLSSSLALGLASAVALAADRVDVEPVARVGLYQDSDATTIVTATTGVTGKLNDQVELGARYLVDIVSSASVDVVSRATQRFHEVRHDLSASGGYRDESQSLVGSYSYSTEHDWTSHNVAVSGSLDLAQHNWTLGASFGLQQNTITRANSIGFERELAAYLATLSLSHPLTRRDLIQISLASSLYDGFQSSPYRYVEIQGQSLLEDYPERRFRQALVLREHHAFDGDWALRSHVRGYVDTYGVKALTVGTEAAIERWPFDAALALRGYVQSKASFYQEQYTTPQEYISVDKELSSFVDVFLGPTFGYGRRAWGGFDALRFEGRVSGFYFRYFDFAALDRRYGVVAELGASASF